MRLRSLIAGLTAIFVLALIPASALADFGIEPGSVTLTAENRDGTLTQLAGSHPFALTVGFAVNADAEGKSEGGEVRNVIVDLPPGLVGNTTAVATCSRQSFEGQNPQCAPDTQVGYLRAKVSGAGEAFGPIYNLDPPPGVAAQLGFSVLGGITSFQYGSVRTEAGYGIRIAAPSIPIAMTEVNATVWGNPADPGHDPERTCFAPNGSTFEGCPSPAADRAFLTMPTSCLAPPELTVSVDSKLAPGVYSEESGSLLNSADQPTALSGCQSVPFSPSVAASPTTTAGDSPSGLGLNLNLPNENLTNAEEDAVAETEPKKLVLTLPEGITANPASVNGQAVCTFAQYKASACPESSKLGSLVADSPLLDEAIEGSLYLAAPHENPFGTLLALYNIAEAPRHGVVVKQAARIDADPETGQLTTTLDDLPPLPYSGFEVRLREGPRAPLITPQACGTYTARAELYPFSDPETATVKTVPFTISTGAGGAACASSEAELPNAPTFSAGVTQPLAGGFSPLVTRISREDGSQRFGAVNLTLPPGLSAKLAGTETCSEAQIAAAQARSKEGEGALEAASPSCPLGSQIATVDVGVGAGSTPYFVQGKAYLAGPYKGAPLSLAIVTPAIAGPFDLGVVVVRAALHINEENAQVTVASDPIPRILAGIPLAVRSVAVNVDRREFTVNPTSCQPTAVTGALTSLTGATAPLTDRFQVGGCGGLGFKPRLQIAFKGKVRRTAHPRLVATLRPRPGDANVSFAQVKLPKAAFLDQSHIGTVCTRVQFAAGAGNGSQCPAASVYGRAEARTPLLGYPLKGTVFLRSSNNVLPDLAVAFSGPPSQPIHFALAGKTDAVKGALRNTFQTAPDVPVSFFRLELFGGKKGLVELSDGLCQRRSSLVRFRGHNGRTYTTSSKVVAACGSKKGKPRR